ncbi:MAG: hypothetical protein JXA28_11170 [Bacteroidetes bacterium]|nr:hypothetical protein [Bacteroidota bacterium]
MRSDERNRARERTTAWFIIAVMAAAMLYFASVGGLLRGLLPAEEAASPPPADLSHITRRAVQLPLSFPSFSTERINRHAEALRSNAVTWCELRIPLWTPTTRNLEYSSYDLRRSIAVIRQLKAHGLGITLAPVYWDGKHMAAIPQTSVARAFFRAYRSMLFDMAETCSAAGADSFLLDGVFGADMVSAADWLHLLNELRDVYAGSIEARMSPGQTPTLYLPHIDGVHVESDQEISERLRTSDIPLQLRTAARDRYVPSSEPWLPMLADADTSMHSMFSALDELIVLDVNGDFVLTGATAFDLLGNERRADNPLAVRVRAMRQRGIDRELMNRQPEFRSAPIPASEPDSHPD